MHKQEIWTIGHSTHTIDEFIEMLQSFRIETLVDIRSLPGSNKFPQFNKEELEISLPKNNIKYIHFVHLGGRRKTGKDSHNTGWRLASFREYADYMETSEFALAISELTAIATKSRTAYMCAEVLWWRCHRSLVSDYLKLNGWTVMHIMGINKATEHTYTKPAVITNHKLTYPPINS